MVLSAVYIDSDVYWFCVTHALSLEKEEIMGLLLGDIVEKSPDVFESDVWDVLLLQRSDRRKDRVEISPEQLAEAAQEAQNISGILKRETRVVGWYHSHPKITVRPSHIDVGTQLSYQVLDRNFVGLIFSVFYQDKEMNQLQICAFQSDFFKQEVPIPLFIGFDRRPHYDHGPLDALLNLSQTFFREEQQAYRNSIKEATAAASAAAGAGGFRVGQTMTQLRNSAVYVKSVCSLLDKIMGPMAHALEAQDKETQREIDELKKERSLLQERIARLENNGSS